MHVKLADGPMNGAANVATNGALDPYINGSTTVSLNGGGVSDLLPWQKIAMKKRAERERKLAVYREWRLQEPVSPSLRDVSALSVSRLTNREHEIVHLDATALVHALRHSKYTSVEVTTAFCKVATVAQDLTNCLTEIFFEEALQRAAELDQHLAQTGRTVGPMHGLPVSIKDHILVKGHDTSTSYISWAYKRIAEKDAVAVQILREAGAVLYVKTANPQTLLSLETNNNIWGRTLNPYNRATTPGGSSGGEGALIALHGSPLGIGTDIGGSIRIPATHSGLYGFKASVARIPHAGLLGSHDGMDAIIGVLGPLARSARDLSLFCNVMLAAKPWLMEAPVLEMPWKTDVANGNCLPPKLCFAILWDDGVVAPVPPVVRALRGAMSALIAKGHEVTDWKPLDHQKGWELISQLYLLDEGKEYFDTMKESGEPAVPQSQWILSHARDRPYTVPEIFQLNLARESFRAAALAHWNQAETRTSCGRIDGIICPVAPSPAPAHDTTVSWTYTSHWNLLDYPAAVFPVGRCSREDACEQVPAQCARNTTEEIVHKLWKDEPGRCVGLPIGLQLIGRRHNEEKVLAMLRVIDQALTQA